MNKVLIADDNAQITKVLKDYANKEGWGSYIAYDGDEALRLFREFSKEISIVFLVLLVFLILILLIFLIRIDHVFCP